MECGWKLEIVNIRDVNGASTDAIAGNRKAGTRSSLVSIYDGYFVASGEPSAI